MKTKYQQIWVVVFACLVIALYVASKLVPLPWANSSSNTGFDDAVVLCEKEARTRFGGNLGYIKFDKSSSRYDRPTEKYRIFFDAQINAPRVTDFYILCAVDAKSGKLLQLDAVDQSGIDKNSKKNRFGWPAR